MENERVISNYTDLLFVSLPLLLLLPLLILLFVDEFSATTEASMFLSFPGLYDSKNASIAVSVGLYI